MYLGKELAEHFDVLDKCLFELGTSDSSVEYAPHIREKFDVVVEAINSLKLFTGVERTICVSESYFCNEK